MATTTKARKTRKRKEEEPAVPYVPTWLTEDDLIFDEDEPLESDWHYTQIGLLKEVIAQHWKGREDYFCGGNMFIYFTEEQAYAVLQNRPTYKGPDLFVVKGVKGRKKRKGWVVWLEGGRYPDLIFELVSPSTRRKDKVENLELYAKVFRTPEYFWYDPDKDELRGYRLQGDVYEPIEPNEQGWLWSEQLGAYVGVWDGLYLNRPYRWVRLYREDGMLIPTVWEEAEQERQRAEQERQRAEEATRLIEQERQRAEEAIRRAEQERFRAEQLANRLRELGIDPDAES